MKLVFGIVLCGILASQGTCSTGDVTIKELGKDVLDEIVKMLEGTLKLIEKCPSPKPSNISLLLYTRKSSNHPITLKQTQPDQIDPSKKVVLIIHGWLAGPTTYGISELKDAYLKRYDCNLIIVDWSKIAQTLYTTAYCEVPKIGELIAEFLCIIQKQLNIDLSTVHIVGHSLGGQMSGFVGQYTVKKCKKRVGRITGLDPAGPLYQDLPESQRLDKADAEYVDVIHTNEKVFGYSGKCGHIDSHVNCGTWQKGCPAINIIHIKDSLVSIVSCSHLRSMYLMAESVNSDNFVAKSCEGCPTPCIGDVPNAVYIVMGEDCPRNSTKTNFEIPTKGSSPFAGGCSIYPGGCS